LTRGGNNFNEVSTNQSNVFILDYTLCFLDCAKLVGLYDKNMPCSYMMSVTAVWQWQSKLVQMLVHNHTLYP